MILAAGDVTGLQFFLMDGAKRYVSATNAPGGAGDLLRSAAALDYALLLSSEHANEISDDAAPVARGLRETLTRASLVALDLIDRMLAAPDDLFEDFVERHIRAHGIFDVLRNLTKSNAVLADDVAFRMLTATNDIVERRRRG